MCRTNRAPRYQYDPLFPESIRCQSQHLENSPGPPSPPSHPPRPPTAKAIVHGQVYASAQVLPTTGRRSIFTVTENPFGDIRYWYHYPVSLLLICFSICLVIAGAQRAHCIVGTTTKSIRRRHSRIQKYWRCSQKFDNSYIFEAHITQ